MNYANLVARSSFELLRAVGWAAGGTRPEVREIKVPRLFSRRCYFSSGIPVPRENCLLLPLSYIALALLFSVLTFRTWTFVPLVDLFTTFSCCRFFATSFGFDTSLLSCLLVLCNALVHCPSIFFFDPSRFALSLLVLKLNDSGCLETDGRKMSAFPFNYS